MNLDNIKSFLGSFTAKDLPTGGAVLVGIILLILLIKAQKAFARIVLLLCAIGLFAGAYWWHTHK